MPTAAAHAEAKAALAAPRKLSVSRRQLLALAASAAGTAAGLARAGTAWSMRAMPAMEPLRQLRAGGPSGWLGVGPSGTLWALAESGGAALRLADGLDAATPLAVGHGRICGRAADGRLWVWEAGVLSRSRAGGLAAHAGLLSLPAAVIALVAEGAAHRPLRYERAAGGTWEAVARGVDAVLPDTRLLQADLDGAGDGGHLVLLAGPDATRYQHGALGDTIEATRVLWLERHSLAVLRELTLPPPFVFEDLAPRALPLPGSRASGLLTMRAGPQGVQLALLAADPAQAGQLRIAALGENVGGANRWLSPTTDGQHWLAVHTPHIGGVLHEYRPEGGVLRRSRLAAGVSNHRFGSRELDMAAWVAGRLVLPSQDGSALRLFDPAAHWAEAGPPFQLPGRVQMTAFAPGAHALAVLLDDGSAVWVRPPEAEGSATAR